jgi:hypothetical protein
MRDDKQDTNPESKDAITQQEVVMTNSKGKTNNTPKLVPECECCGAPAGSHSTASTGSGAAVVHEHYEIVDPRPNAAAAPFTFHLPDAAALSAAGEGDSVQAIFRGVPPDEEIGAERMWVDITSAAADWVEGPLANEPFTIPNLEQGALIHLPRSHIITVRFSDPSREPVATPKRRFGERCVVDKGILAGTCDAVFVYRETPCLTKDDDAYPDSGWRIRSKREPFSGNELESEQAFYVGLCFALNANDTWLHLIDEPIGVAFEKDPETGLFV